MNRFLPLLMAAALLCGCSHRLTVPRSFDYQVYQTGTVAHWGGKERFVVADYTGRGIYAFNLRNGRGRKLYSIPADQAPAEHLLPCTGDSVWILDREGWLYCSSNPARRYSLRLDSLQGLRGAWRMWPSPFREFEPAPQGTYVWMLVPDPPRDFAKWAHQPQLALWHIGEEGPVVDTLFGEYPSTHPMDNYFRGPLKDICLNPSDSLILVSTPLSTSVRLYDYHGRFLRECEMSDSAFFVGPYDRKMDTSIEHTIHYFQTYPFFDGVYYDAVSQLYFRLLRIPYTTVKGMTQEHCERELWLVYDRQMRHQRTLSTESRMPLLSSKGLYRSLPSQPRNPRLFEPFSLVGSDGEVFQWYMRQLRQRIPQEEHEYILVPDASCIGCRDFMLQYAARHPRTTTIIMSPNLKNQYARVPEARLVVDRKGLVNQLNWNHYNVIQVITSQGRLRSVRSFSTDEMLNTFAP